MGKAFHARIASIDHQIASEIKKSGCKNVGVHMPTQCVVQQMDINGMNWDCAVLPIAGIPVSVVSIQTAIDKHNGKPVKARYFFEVEITAYLTLK